MTKKELEKILDDKDFKETQVYFDHQNINVVIYTRDDNLYSVVSYHICYPAETMLKQEYKTIQQIFESWLFRKVLKNSFK